MKNRYADVIVDITHEKLDRSFQYLIPEELSDKIYTGSRVYIPFGNGNRKIAGYVIGFSEEPGIELNKMKPILGLVQEDTSEESRLIALAGWMRRQYGSTMIRALKTVIPMREKQKVRQIQRAQLLLNEQEAEEKEEYFRSHHQSARLRLLQKLRVEKIMEVSEIRSQLKIGTDVMRKMEEQGILRITSEVNYRNPVHQDMTSSTEEFSLTAEQKITTDKIWEEWYAGKGRPCLLQGVTGSGKTQVYMELISRTLELGKQVIVLIPEIALTYQTVSRFYRRFGNCVAVMNSKLTAAERFDQFERAKREDASIMIGPRSALFTPFTNLGLIIIDEEHESSYKSEQTPRYHAVDTAIERAHLENAKVLLGSATPSVDTYYRCEEGSYAKFLLEKRYGNALLPTVYTVDMREELKRGNRSILSIELQKKIEERLQRGEQIMLFLNRRGYSGFISCRSCGHVLKCPHCDVSLTEHSNGTLVCHYCGYTVEKAKNCPECGSPYIGGFRAGTQQIEQVVRKYFPSAGILRMDLDTTREKSSYERILKAFADQKADILIGTQMIVKGHDFPQVTLVGVLAADLSLFASDYRSSERTFQLLTQAVGRAGRGNLPGEAVIQTYHPEHYSIQAALNQDYLSFYREEMAYRQLMGYPPVSQLLSIHAQGAEEPYLAQAMEYIRKFLFRIRRKPEIRIIGPAAETVSRINDLYRIVIYIRSANSEDLLEMREKLERYIEINRGFDQIYIQFDMNS